MRSVDDDDLRALYAGTTTIAVVGCSARWPKPPAVVPAYMQSEGFRIQDRPGESERGRAARRALPLGIVSDEAAWIAADGGLTVVMDDCIGITFGELGLGAGVAAGKAKQEVLRA